MFKRILCLTILLVSLSSCSSLSVNEILNTAATSTVAAVSTAAGVPPVAVLATTAAAGVATGVVTPEPTVDPVVETGWEALTRITHDLIVYIIGGFVVLTIVAWLLPGPQHIFRRKKDDKSNITNNRT